MVAPTRMGQAESMEFAFQKLPSLHQIHVLHPSSFSGVFWIYSQTDLRRTFSSLNLLCNPSVKDCIVSGGLLTHKSPFPPIFYGWKFQIGEKTWLMCELSGKKEIYVHFTVAPPEGDLGLFSEGQRVTYIQRGHTESA
jgi:hypothetical protein